VFPAPSLIIEFETALPAERAQMSAMLAGADLSAWTVLRGWMGPRVG
jgi:hypothetical protein